MLLEHSSMLHEGRDHTDRVLNLIALFKDFLQINENRGNI